jgi:putative ABC transport system ATP-binding protein
VAIARALACGPEILLADEPTGNLDTATSKQVLDLISQLRIQLGLTVIMVTHNLTVAGRADRCLHIVDGRIVNDRLAAPSSNPSMTQRILSGEVRA